MKLCARSLKTGEEKKYFETPREPRILEQTKLLRGVPRVSGLKQVYF